MNPFAVKIWIAGCRAVHTSTSCELTTIVPKRVFPDPAKRRSRRPPGKDAGRGVEVGAEAPCEVAEAPAVFVEPAFEPLLEAGIRVETPGEPAVPPPPQPAKRITASSAARESTATPPECP
jgi:hypothetical protein